MDNKILGVVLVVLSIAMFILTYSFTNEIQIVMTEGCSSCIEDSGFCPHAGNLPWQSYLGFSVSGIVFVLGLYLIITGKKGEALALERSREVKRLVKDLKKDEKQVFELVAEAGGVMFQSEVVEKTEFPKAKVSRILDRLEGKRLVERRRRGMSNAVILKGGRNG